MRYEEYLRWEGGGAIVLGVALAALAAPGLLVSYPGAWAAPLFVLAYLGGVATIGRRKGRPPARWVTGAALERAAAPGARTPLPAPAMRRRLAAETLGWIVLGAALLLVFGSSGLLFFGTGLASVAFGALRVLGARAVPPGYLVAGKPLAGPPQLVRAG